jgi:hypothetical protein
MDGWLRDGWRRWWWRRRRMAAATDGGEQAANGVGGEEQACHQRRVLSSSTDSGQHERAGAGLCALGTRQGFAAGPVVVLRRRCPCCRTEAIGGGGGGLHTTKPTSHPLTTTDPLTTHTHTHTQTQPTGLGQAYSHCKNMYDLLHPSAADEKRKHKVRSSVRPSLQYCLLE